MRQIEFRFGVGDPVSGAVPVEICSGTEEIYFAPRRELALRRIKSSAAGICGSRLQGCRFEPGREGGLSFGSDWPPEAVHAHSGTGTVFSGQSHGACERFAVTESVMCILL